MSRTVEQVKQRDMLGAVATIYRAADWPLVVDLHANKVAPTQQSGPDIMACRPGERVVVKVFGPKGKMSAQQEAVRKDYEAAGFEYRIYTPDDFEQAVADANA